MEQQQTGVFFDHHQRLETRILKRVNIKQLFMLLSVSSLFSLVFSSSNCPSFLQPFNSFISTSFLFRLLTHTVDKNCIFLICNGILVFLARSSGLIKGSRFRSSGSYKAGPRQITEPLPLYTMKVPGFEYADERLPLDLRGSGYSPVEEGNKGNEDLIEDHKVSKEEEETITLVGGEEKLIEQGGFDWYGDDDFIDDQIEEREREEEEEEEEFSGSKILSTEELNKKFDEFIKRMKEEIRIEDQQQLVVV